MRPRNGGPTLQPGASRSRRLVAGIISAGGARLLILAAPFVTLPVLLNELGAAAVGLLFFMSSLSAVAAFADLGLGNGILTLLPQALARGDRVEARKLTSSAYALLTGISLLILGIVAAVAMSGRLRSFAEAIAPDIDEGLAQAIIAYSAVSFAVTIPLSVVQRVQYSVQEAWASNVWQIAAAAASVGAVFGGVALGVNTSTLVALSIFSLPVILAVNTATYFSRRKHRDLTPTWRLVSQRVAASMLRLGGRFLLLSILTSTALNIDNVIVAKILNMESVATYSIASRLFSVLSLAVTFIALPLWPANSDALTRGDIRWVRQTTRNMMAISTIAVLSAGVLLIYFRDLIFSLWLDETIPVSLLLAAAFTAWSALLAFASPLFSVQNAQGVLVYQTIGWALYLAVSIPAKYWLLSISDVAAVPLAGSILYAVFVIPAAWLGYRASLRHVSQSVGNAP